MAEHTYDVIAEHTYDVIAEHAYDVIAEHAYDVIAEHAYAVIAEHALMSVLRTQAGTSRVHHPRLHSKFETSLSYTVKPCLRKLRTGNVTY